MVTPSTFRFLVLVTCVLPLGFAEVRAAAETSVMKWGSIVPLPDPVGFAAPYVGIVDGGLLVAGGANFPNGRPWDGAKKIWHDRVFFLAGEKQEWRVIGRLPSPSAYGVSVTLPDGLLCIGGSSGDQHLGDVLHLSLTSEGMQIEKWPNLSEPLANSSGVLVGVSAYIVGGQAAPDQQPTNRVWMIDLSSGSRRQWREIESLPARPRMLAMVGAIGENLYVFGGVDLVRAGDGSWKRDYLKDAWRYSPAEGWSRLADLPEPRAAAPTPVPVAGNELLILGGDDGTLADQFNILKERHPGFSRTVFAYDSVENRWTKKGEFPSREIANPSTVDGDSFLPPVTTSAIWWESRWVIPSGETRPAVRTARVLSLELSTDR